VVSFLPVADDVLVVSNRYVSNLSAPTHLEEVRKT
jgi:hypothetical protein